jgi:hypothetical protein
VLEREGFEVDTDAGSADVTVQVDETYWTLRTREGCVSGETFRTLAARLRVLPIDTNEAES